MLTVNGAVYKDVTPHDFNHYFASTAMAWKLSPSKRRLFVVSTLEGQIIKGTYLTRDKEFKPRTINFKDWWESLDAITLQPLMFNLPGGAGVWLQKLNKNQRKSFPWFMNAVRFHGNVQAGDRSSQIVTHAAFAELYGMETLKPRLVDALLTNEDAIVTRERFLIDRATKTLWYKTLIVGGLLDGGKIGLVENKAHLIPLFTSVGVARNKIELVPIPVKPVHLQDIVPMKYNPDWIHGYSVDAYPDMGYSVIRFIKPGHPGEIRTYRGKFPGKEFLMTGWTVHNYWGQ